jgi:hypothetical protein
MTGGSCEKTSMLPIASFKDFSGKGKKYKNIVLVTIFSLDATLFFNLVLAFFNKSCNKLSSFLLFFSFSFLN